MKRISNGVESGDLLSADVLRKIAETHGGIADNPELIAVVLELHPHALALASVICLHDAKDCNKEIQLCSQGLSSFMALLISVGMELEKRLSEPTGKWKN